MSDSDKAVVEHIRGRHAVALGLHNQQIAGMESSDPRYPGALAASALSLEREGRHGEAVSRVQEALYLSRSSHNDSVEDAAQRAEQLPSVRVNAGTVLLRDAALLRQNGRYTEAANRHRYADDILALALEGVKQQQASRFRPHQHVINVLPRVAMSEAVNGNPKKAIKYALGALVLAPLSETPGLVVYTSGAGFRGSLFAKAKGVIRGVNALRVATTALPRAQANPKKARRRDEIILSRFGA